MFSPELIDSIILPAFFPGESSYSQIAIRNFNLCETEDNWRTWNEALVRLNDEILAGIPEEKQVNTDNLQCWKVLEVCLLTSLRSLRSVLLSTCCQLISSSLYPKEPREKFGDSKKLIPAEFTGSIVHALLIVCNQSKKVLAQMAGQTIQNLIKSIQPFSPQNFYLSNIVILERIMECVFEGRLYTEYSARIPCLNDSEPGNEDIMSACTYNIGFLSQLSAFASTNNSKLSTVKLNGSSPEDGRHRLFSSIISIISPNGGQNGFVDLDSFFSSSHTNRGTWESAGTNSVCLNGMSVNSSQSKYHVLNSPMSPLCKQIASDCMCTLIDRVTKEDLQPSKDSCSESKLIFLYLWTHLIRFTRIALIDSSQDVRKSSKKIVLDMTKWLQNISNRNGNQNSEQEKDYCDYWARLVLFNSLNDDEKAISNFDVPERTRRLTFKEVEVLLGKNSSSDGENKSNSHRLGRPGGGLKEFLRKNRMKKPENEECSDKTSKINDIVMNEMPEEATESTERLQSTTCQGGTETKACPETLSQRSNISLHSDPPSFVHNLLSDRLMSNYSSHSEFVGVAQIDLVGSPLFSNDATHTVDQQSTPTAVSSLSKAPSSPAHGVADLQRTLAWELEQAQSFPENEEASYDNCSTPKARLSPKREIISPQSDSMNVSPYLAREFTGVEFLEYVAQLRKVLHDGPEQDITNDENLRKDSNVSSKYNKSSPSKKSGFSRTHLENLNLQDSLENIAKGIRTHWYCESALSTEKEETLCTVYSLLGQLISKYIHQVEEKKDAYHWLQETVLEVLLSKGSRNSAVEQQLQNLNSASTRRSIYDFLSICSKITTEMADSGFKVQDRIAPVQSRILTKYMR